ncbi:Acg family FMN-binding oxidoreductase [Actinoplanes couchii]|uniref:Nitroreductase n=1 Tax=Actinoplanes couchii TaxID=403638 RepID=A0ABQ3X1D2_9ACTN|nr:nitroreductase [Actinoplanes couchii]MDR6316728.1 nitroreductase [Actinoplanes couchii]GID52336.1 nitroreductase [Actinoplanes couchii]
MRKTLEECVRSATTAPSLHNSQPWRFRIHDDRVDVLADPARKLAVLDPDGREMMISVGAAVFTLRLSLMRAGFVPQPEIFDDGATVRVGRPGTPTPAVEALAAAIPHRHTNRQPFARAAVPAAVLADLIAAAHREGALLHVPPPVARNAVLGLSRVADRRLRARGGYRAELARWTTQRRIRRDGVPPSAYGPGDPADTLPLRDFGLLQPQLSRPGGRFEPDPTLLVLATRGDVPADRVRAGQALQRVLLAATWHGLAVTPISQPVEVPALRERLTDVRRNVWGQMVLRVGYGVPVMATPRRPLSEVLAVP